MPNPTALFGFRPIIRIGGSPFSLTQYGKAAADVNPIYAFDLVGHLTGGVPFPLPENPTYNLSRVQDGSQITPGTGPWLGASLAYGAASVGSVHPVADEIDCVFLCRAGTTNAAMTTANCAGLNVNVKLGAGSPLTKMSAQGADDNTFAATNTLDLRIQKISMISPNVEGPNTMLEVTINRHAMAQLSAGT